jgi:SAM-dependent methyltransferase
MAAVREHWDALYARKAPEEVSWYQPHLERSLSFIDQAKLDREAPIIDVGGGTSTLVDDLLDRAFTDLTVLDISQSAIDAAKARLGDRAERVHWIVADVTEATLKPESYVFWHDRAVFHFLREETARRKYVANVRRAVKAGGHVLVATFGPEGPQRCNGLEVVRYGADELHGQFGSDFTKVGSVVENHRTPSGTEQQFLYCYCRLQPT